jgi:hypothetical protein
MQVCPDSASDCHCTSGLFDHVTQRVPIKVFLTGFDECNVLSTR